MISHAYRWTELKMSCTCSIYNSDAYKVTPNRGWYDQQIAAEVKLARYSDMMEAKADESK